jgi:hypothetical protein
MQRIRQFAVLIGAALAQLSRYLFTNVTNPTFWEVKANDANRVVVLAFPQIVDDSLKSGIFNVCLAPGTTHSAEIVEDQIDIWFALAPSGWSLAAGRRFERQELRVHFRSGIPADPARKISRRSGSLPCRPPPDWLKGC